MGRLNFQPERREFIEWLNGKGELEYWMISVHERLTRWMKPAPVSHTLIKVDMS